MLDLICDNQGNPVTEFGVKVQKVQYVYNVNTSVTRCFYEILLSFTDGKVKSVRLNKDELGKVTWYKFDERCCFSANVPEAKAKRLLLNAVLKGATTASKETVYHVEKVGFFKVDGELGFFTGTEIIDSPTGKIRNLEIIANEQKMLLDIDTSLTEKRAIQTLFDFFKLSPNATRIILVHKLMYLMYSAFADTGISPHVSVFIYGASGTQKTTIANFLIQMYGRKNGIKSAPRLNSSEAAAKQILIESPYDTILLDDLYPAEEKKDRRKQESTLLEVNRWVGDGTVSLRKKGNETTDVSIYSGAVFTGEYLIGDGSNAARLLPVKMEKPDLKKLDSFQKNKLWLSTFYYYFLIWYIKNYADIVEEINSWKEEYQKYEMDISSHLKTMHSLFNTTFTLLLNYCYDKNVFSESEIREMQRNFGETITCLIEEQNLRASKQDEPVAKQVDYFKEIQMLYRDRRLNIVSNVKEFELNKHDGLVYGDNLCLRGKKICEYFPDTTIEQIIEQLLSRNVLVVGKDRVAKQISALGGKRFYVIPLKFLECN